MATDDRAAPRPVGNPAADRRREEAMKLFLDDEGEHGTRCRCRACVEYYAIDKAGAK